MYKNISHVESKIIGSQIKFSITLNFCFDSDYKQCVPIAFSKLDSFISLRGSGAPTLNKISFDGFYVDVPPFPNNNLAINEAKEFLTELDDFLTSVVDAHNKLVCERKNQEEKRKTEQEKIEKKAKELNDFFNN